ncbi:hypothetical protein RCL_jg15388.t1 [Rhizophagus clarus]|uniref:Uncharacterized protein n=1 Tax=Rhizophagus clarus TaxID=94130 RepID=A0A8H3QAK6_9GLOM|nr:hypothetical protein RCL_jg15388.t1 [Rhizophagus clarus]
MNLRYGTIRSMISRQSKNLTSQVITILDDIKHNRSLIKTSDNILREWTRGIISNDIYNTLAMKENKKWVFISSLIIYGNYKIPFGTRDARRYRK